MADLGTNVRYIKGIGEARAAALEKLGITTLGDLIAYFPRGYEDRTQVRPIRELTAGESVCVRGMVAADLTAYRISGGRTIAKTRVVDDSGSLDLVFFNMEHRRDALHQGDVCVFFGKVEDNLRRKQMINPLFEPEGRQQVTGRIMPIYPLTAGVTQGLMARAARQGLDACRELLPDVLPDEVRQAHKLCYVNYAYENIHFPASPEALEVARRRLVFEELFLLTCGLQLLRQRRRDVAGPACRRMSMEPFYRRLPFALTGAQRRAIADAVEDMVSGKPMNRLCQGDVGSGKTMVAAACIWFAVENGWQTALMAPTEILARQHYQGLAPLLARFSIRCALLTGSTRAKERREILAGLADGSIDLCIGTHALLTEDVQYQKLGLVVTDEQHRFGVNQRAALSQKAEDPHLLVLSATPIPRTLALVIYGDLDVSVIDELPPGRQKVDTFALGESYRPRVQAFIRKLAAVGQQIFIVCPLVGEADQIPDERKAVTAYARQLQEQVFPDLRVAVLHGKMKPREKEKVMAAFAAGESDILVSTTVVEVGVDVPNATCMVVENADRFGLSQLHQLRGRVGRGKAKSYCILLSDSQNEETRARLKVMTQTNDGFRISQEDLRLRGPGDFFGQRQHGLPAMKIADLSCDMRLLDEAQTAARQLMERDPELTDPTHRPLRRRIRQLFDTNADMLN
ncbi:ATP-dependent DNA helicase RecG [Oscillospiraceae bacterium CLA-AA-H272]|uniref:ATP-dependent DNA helicase RecG n=1 Tax=Brotocaccenecus cirricatena TaxID=3064195 RepID=A0AAE3DCZ0_9FIRM|nr:ATP-dependent DNA helicase RecG [Brotocaccenecus cirricatena]MCC2128302.1 ATP-dependent DNA helicase RecG [Brotocaccenecus cirricatena]